MAKVFIQLVDTLEMGGAERMSINIAAVMAEKGYESHLVVSRRSGGMAAHIPSQVNVYFLNKKKFYDLGAFARLVRIIKKLNPDLVHAHSTSIFWAVALKIITGRFLLVWHDHFGLSDQLDQFPRKEMLYLARWIDRIVCVNAKLENYWKRMLPEKREQIVTIENFPYLVLKKKTKKKPFTFLHLANFRKQKNHQNMLQAIRILAESRDDFQVMMVGEYVDDDVKAQVFDIIKQHELENLVIVHGPENDVSKVLNSCQAGVLSSDSEGLPVALLEYGLAGLPVVCTDVGDCGKVVSSSDFGLVVAAKDAKALAEGMNQLLSDQEEANHMGERLKNKVLKEYGADAFFEKYVSLLQLK